MAEGDWPKVDGDVFFASEANKLNGRLGEIRQFALSITGAITKAVLQAEGWAICDGTTPASQGISSPTITTTPDLREKFLRHSANETTGGTGGSATKDLMHTHTVSFNKTGVSGREIDASYGNQGNFDNYSGNLFRIPNTTSGSSGSSTQDILPPYYDICYFMKVK